MTLEELKAQRRAIDQQIRQMEKAEYTYGCAKLDILHFVRGDEWRVSVKSLQPDGLNQSRYRGIINCKDKEDAISNIDTVINDLIGLKEKLSIEE